MSQRKCLLFSSSQMRLQYSLSYSDVVFRGILSTNWACSFDPEALRIHGLKNNHLPENNSRVLAQVWVLERAPLAATLMRMLKQWSWFIGWYVSSWSQSWRSSTFLPLAMSSHPGSAMPSQRLKRFAAAASPKTIKGPLCRLTHTPVCWPPSAAGWGDSACWDVVKPSWSSHL